MRPIPVGAKGSFNLLVQPEHLANRFKDAMLPPVFATPVMIMVMENAALNAIRAFLDPGESAVGTAVNVRHLEPAAVEPHLARRYRDLRPGFPRERGGARRSCDCRAAGYDG